MQRRAVCADDDRRGRLVEVKQRMDAALSGSIPQYRFHLKNFAHLQRHIADLGKRITISRVRKFIPAMELGPYQQSGTTRQNPC